MKLINNSIRFIKKSNIYITIMMNVRILRKGERRNLPIVLSIFKNYLKNQNIQLLILKTLCVFLWMNI